MKVKKLDRIIKIKEILFCFSVPCLRGFDYRVLNIPKRIKQREIREQGKGRSLT